MWSRVHKESVMKSEASKREELPEKGVDSAIPGPGAEIWGLEVIGDVPGDDRTGSQKEKMPMKNDYTHFVAVQIKTSSIKERMGVFQDQFKKFKRNAWVAEVPTSKAHITLRMMALPTEENVHLSPPTMIAHSTHFLTHISLFYARPRS
jgi:hypothetical protein